MTRYRIWHHERGQWRAGDTWSDWPTAAMAMTELERAGYKAICVVRDGPIDRYLDTNGRLPKHALKQLARLGKHILAERGTLDRNPTGD